MLIDDEPPALKVLESHISQINGLEIVAQCKNALEALDILTHKTVDLVFLDIKMPKLLGTDFIKSLTHPPTFIFVTAYRDYAVEGYDLDAADFLVKPVSFERFLKAILKVRRTVGLETSSPVNTPKENSNAFVYLKVDKNMQKVYLDDILYIESWKDYIKVFLTTGKNMLVKQSISAMENLLSDHKFIRLHRSYIVSLDKITSYNALSVQLDGIEVPIGRLYKQTVMELLQE
jgi:DNA-binding LytR/AlgR family response regulator